MATFESFSALARAHGLSAESGAPPPAEPEKSKRSRKARGLERDRQRLAELQGRFDAGEIEISGQEFEELAKLRAQMDLIEGRKASVKGDGREQSVESSAAESTNDNKTPATVREAPLDSRPPRRGGRDVLYGAAASTGQRKTEEVPVDPSPNGDSAAAEQPSAKVVTEAVEQPAAETQSTSHPEPRPLGQPTREYLQGLTLEDLQGELRRTRAHADLGHEDAQAALNDFYTELDRRRREQRRAVKPAKHSRPPKQAKPTPSAVLKTPAAPVMSDEEMQNALGEAVGPSSLLTDEGDPFMKGTAAVGVENGSADPGTTETPPDTTEAPTIPTPAPSESAAPSAQETASEAAKEDVPKPEPEELKPEESGTDKHDEVPPTERPMRQWKAGVVEIEEKVEDIARHRAEERLQAEHRGERLEGGKRPGWLQRLVLKTSRHWGDDGYRQMYIAAERKRIMAQLEGVDPNIFSPDEKTSQAHRAEAQEIVKRFLADFEGAVRTNEGERKETLAEGQTKTAIKDVMTQYVNGDIDERTFIEQKGKLLHGLKAENQALFEKEGATVDNLLDVAREIRATMQHGERIAGQDVNVDINLGKYRSAIKEQANLRAFDKLVKVIQKNPVLSKVVNPAVLGFTVSLASKPLISGVRGLAKYAGVSALGLGTAFGAVFAALRRSTEVKGDITHARRGMTAGYETPKGAKRLEKMKEFMYDTTRATNLTDNLRSSVELLESLDLNDPRSMQRVQETLQAIAAIEARLDLAAATKHDFMAFDDPTTIERQRFDMLKTIAQAKVKVQAIFPQVARVAGDPNTMEQSLGLHKESREGELRARVEDVDRRFKHFKNKEVAKAAAYGAVTGFIAGSVAQVGMNWVREHVMHEQNVPHSMLEKLWSKVTGHDVREYVDQGPPHSVQVGDKMRLLLPQDVRAIEDPDKPGFVDFLDERGKKLFEFKPDLEHGTMPEADKAFLMKQGWYVGERDVIESMGERQTFTPAEWMEKTAHGTKRIARDAWYDNNTPEVFDKNELRLHWGGANGVGIDEQGNYVFNVLKMKPDGSFHGQISADAPKLVEQGDMRMMLSLSRETQKMVYEVAVDKNGNAIIDPNSEVGKLLFRNAGGKAEFLGRFAEASQLLRDEHGQLIINDKGEQVVRELATYEGNGLTGVTVDQWENKDHITDLLRPTGQEWELPPVIPLSKRKPLERFVRKTPESPYYDTYLSEARKKEFAERRSETLRANPDATLDEAHEVRSYLDSIPEDDRKRLEAMDATIGEAMAKETRLVIVIPSYQEAENIQKTLEQYMLQQTIDGKPIDSKRFEIVVFVNRPEGIADDGTMAKLAEFRAKHPDLKVRAVEMAYPEKQLIGKIRKDANDLALLRAAKREAADGKLIIVNNDADAERISPTYVDRFIREFDEHPEIDAAVGKLDFAPEAFENMPFLHATRRLMQYLETALRRYGDRSRPRTYGANSAIRAETYSAVGGFNPRSRLGEDLELGAMVREARAGTKRKPIIYVNAAEVITSPRRQVVKGKAGVSLFKEYEDWATNEAIRDTEWREVLAQGPDAFSIPRFEKEASLLYGWMKRDAPAFGIANPDQVFGRAMGFLGVKFEIQKNEVKVRDASRLMEGIKTYPERHRKVSSAKERRRKVKPSTPESGKEAA